MAGRRQSRSATARVNKGTVVSWLMIGVGTMGLLLVLAGALLSAAVGPYLKGQIAVDVPGATVGLGVSALTEKVGTCYHIGGCDDNVSFEQCSAKTHWCWTKGPCQDNVIQQVGDEYAEKSCSELSPDELRELEIKAKLRAADKAESICASQGGKIDKAACGFRCFTKDTLSGKCIVACVHYHTCVEHSEIPVG